ncbi:class I SAM-dependent methyltransferase [Akkermansiaceae bacterium]|nr:class I SAM-dependent methyltransferase [Akkermansiaceae bacterium]
MKNKLSNLKSKIVPNNVKQRIIQSNFFNNRKAARLASSSKRIDICATQFAHMFHLSNHAPIEGKVCLEIGAGWVLSHSLVCYLLGAKRIIATDIFPCARPDALSFALKDAIVSIPRDVLAPFSDHTSIRERYERLLSISHFSFQSLEELGIEYKSPIDLAREQLDISVDFIHSNSVLEHVPKDDVRPLLNNLAECLNYGGTMINCIHLEDHKDFNNFPFSFLDIPQDKYPPTIQTKRGNRLRCSEWEGLFNSLETTSSDFIYRHVRRDKKLPPSIDRSINHSDEIDLKTSHIGVFTKK